MTFRGWTTENIPRNARIRAVLGYAGVPPREEPLRAPSKYGNERTNGYASKKEAARARELHLMAAAGEIFDLREQVPFLLIPEQRDKAGKLIERKLSYVADFTYATRDGRHVVEDCKGHRTRAYIQKRKLLLFVHRIRVLET